MFRAALEAGEPPFAVLHVHGPGGIGKSCLLDAYDAVASELGARPVRVDGREVEPAPPAVLEMLAEFLDVPESGPIRGPSRVVLLVDAYERLAALDDWLRTELLPRLPGDSVTVLAGRRPPAPPWRADPAWAELLRVVSLRNFDGVESGRLLSARGVRPELHDRLVALSHGHPLALALLADLAARDAALPVDGFDPDLIATMLRRIVDVVPDSRQRRALEICALARVTTEALLPADDAAELFEWLHELSFVEAGPEGLVPHDLARDVLDVALRWRDPEGYRRTFRALRAHVHARARAERGRAQLSALLDQKFLFRNLPGILSPVQWTSWGHHYPEQARRRVTRRRRSPGAGGMPSPTPSGCCAAPTGRCAVSSRCSTSPGLPRMSSRPTRVRRRHGSTPADTPHRGRARRSGRPASWSTPRPTRVRPRR